jgi:muramidase (phage lysozyme)
MTNELKPKSKNDDPAFQDQMAVTLDQIKRIADNALAELAQGRASAYAAQSALMGISSLVSMLTLPGDIEDARNNASPILIGKWKDADHD